MRIIGIAGGSGSGKSTLTERIRRAFPGTAVLYHDNYYRNHPGLSAAGRAELNYDHPDALETELLIEHLRALKRGENVRCPVYDFSTHSRSGKDILVEPPHLLIVEGILLFHWPELRELLDWRIFVDVDADIRLLRRILRDTAERGRTVADIAAQYLATVRPMHLQFVEPTRQYADLVVHNCLDEEDWNAVKAGIEALAEAGH